MKRITLLSLFILLSGVFAIAQETTEGKQAASAAEKKDGPYIEFDQTVIDYGTIPHKSDGVRNFTFRNTGNKPLVITNAKGSCGCTVPTYPKEPIKPGETGVIAVSYDTNRIGSFHKTVTINSNAVNGTVILQIKGVVLGPDGEQVPDIQHKHHNHDHDHN